jgi:3',5'-cyclic AMP phosphodiesterase CpdA
MICNKNRFIFIGVLFLLAYPWKSAEAIYQGKPDTVTFIQITDPHFSNLTGYHPVFVRERIWFSRSAGILSGFLTAVPEKHNADFIVVTGDNVDFYEAETATGTMLGTQIEQYSEFIGKNRIPIYLTLGNHDLTSYRVTSDSLTTNNQLKAEKARSVWMRNFDCFREGTYYSRTLRIDTVDFRLIFLDNSYYATQEVSDGVMQFVMDPYQLMWFNAELQSSPSDVELIFMHMPLPFSSASDKEIPVEPLSEYTSKSKYYHLLNVLDSNKANARIIFAGHRHFNSINNYTLREGGSISQVMTGALSYDPGAWRIVKLTSGKIIISYPGNPESEYVIPIGKQP